jgi:hypothetical protein
MWIKIPLTPSGIDPATFWFVAQRLNHCATACPCAVLYNQKYTAIRTCTAFCLTDYLRPTNHCVPESNVQQYRYIITCDIPIPDLQLTYPKRLCTPDNFTRICRSHFTCIILTFVVSVYEVTSMLLILFLSISGKRFLADYRTQFTDVHFQPTADYRFVWIFVRCQHVL